MQQLFQSLLNICKNKPYQSLVCNSSLLSLDYKFVKFGQAFETVQVVCRSKEIELNISSFEALLYSADTPKLILSPI